MLLLLVLANRQPHWWLPSVQLTGRRVGSTVLSVTLPFRTGSQPNERMLMANATKCVPSGRLILADQPFLPLRVIVPYCTPHPAQKCLGKRVIID